MCAVRAKTLKSSKPARAVPAPSANAELEQGGNSQLQERVLRVAARLFANRGFHAVSIREIAAECEVSVSTVLYAGRTKQQLLEDILARSFTHDTTWPMVLAQLDPAQQADREAFYRAYDIIVDKLVDHAFAFPDTRRLWIRLQLDQPELFASLEAEYTWPLIRHSYDLLRAARDRGIIHADDSRLQLLISGIDWFMNGFFAGGVVGFDGRRIDPTLPESVDQLRQFLHDYGRVWFPAHK